MQKNKIFLIVDKKISYEIKLQLLLLTLEERISTATTNSLPLQFLYPTPTTSYYPPPFLNKLLVRAM